MKTYVVGTQSHTFCQTNLTKVQRWFCLINCLACGTLLCYVSMVIKLQSGVGWGGGSNHILSVKVQWWFCLITCLACGVLFVMFPW